MAGINRSKVKGPGLEFSQYRSYQPGDDLRWLDWKRYARSDRYYIRESEIETSISIRLLVDASNSMGHRDGDDHQDGICTLAGCVAGLAGALAGGCIGVVCLPRGKGVRLAGAQGPAAPGAHLASVGNARAGGSIRRPDRLQTYFSRRAKKGAAGLYHRPVRTRMGRSAGCWNCWRRCGTRSSSFISWGGMR